MHASILHPNAIKPDMTLFVSKLLENMTKLWHDATAEFVKAVAVSDLIHVDTGMSKSSLLPLARAVKMVSKITITPERANVAGKTAALGEKIGEKAFTLKFGTAANPIYVFEFKILVYQYFLHERTGAGRASNSLDYRSLEVGQEAFRGYIQNNAAEYIPKLKDWIR